ncbi:hypothetical protein E3P92_03208 [Wallemia ichthyophaga]|uniref:Uncharacterized protein n=1 Tax=Wallemia ichthyophaga (strain EXF-994 / CBS 113033) TaxID=1299270 RepID=R9AEM9_WALI9|nr:uncharacterized protein J056_000788 [Wallemia ichthyophaga EXF-994]EOR00590.1 hypothetical protein J056_000788 [Wallemia ichthyophaga EXF-994]TIB10451.1 hypothetical protein E3P92_03208 [Wallemia ichthyophaga]TIB31191.1 hypothetical protein E3P84_03067 [Wallemia ichthyophaga]TIB40324.1 hypothetical protein E3P83_03010 [Wallemia ichthyophaga]
MARMSPDDQKRDAIDAKNNRVRKLKERPVWGIGGVFPSEENIAEEDFQRGQQGNDVFKAAAEIVYSRGMQLGKEMSEEMNRRRIGNVGETSRNRSGITSNGNIGRPKLKSLQRPERSV